MPDQQEAAPCLRVVVVVGVVGSETAYFLAHELGKKVALIEMLPVIMRGVCTANRRWLI